MYLEKEFTEVFVSENPKRMDLPKSLIYFPSSYVNCPGINREKGNKGGGGKDTPRPLQ